MAGGVQVWSNTPANNAGSDQAINWAEGMAPSAVNDSARSMMASVANWRDDNSGVLATSGTSIAFTVATNQVEAALTAGYTVTVQFNATNDLSATLSVDNLAAVPMQIVAGTNLSGGEFQAGTIQRFTLSTTASTLSANGQWISQGFINPPAVVAPISLTSFSATLNSSVNIGTSAYVDGPSIAVTTSTSGSTGVWYVCAAATFLGNAGAASSIFTKLWDGTNAPAYALQNIVPTNTQNSISMCGIIASPAGNIRMSAVASNACGFLGSFNATPESTGPMPRSYLTALRIG